MMREGGWILHDLSFKDFTSECVCLCKKVRRLLCGLSQRDPLKSSKKPSCEITKKRERESPTSIFISLKQNFI
jgi:hypothetical protein